MRILRRVALITLAPCVALVSGAAVGQTAEQEEDPAVALQGKFEELSRLWQAGDHEAAIPLLHGMIEDAENAGRSDLIGSLTYNLACANSLLNRSEKAFQHLGAAIQAGFSNFLHMRSDSDLDNIRSLPEFEVFILKLKEGARIQWSDEAAEALEPHVDDPGSDELRLLRRDYGLDSLVADSKTTYEQLRHLVSWAHSSFGHDGGNEPSKPDPLTILEEAADGEMFRCTEYATVLMSAARALGLSARALALLTRDVETRASGAAHVVAEVWLPDAEKWVFADAQFDVIPERNGVPLNAVELRDAILSEDGELTCRSSSGAQCDAYQSWIWPYLYHFFVEADQRFYDESPVEAKDVMLVPEGSKHPEVFQRSWHPYENTRLTSNPEVFYAPLAP